MVLVILVVAVTIAVAVINPVFVKYKQNCASSTRHFVYMRFNFIHFLKKIKIVTLFEKSHLYDSVRLLTHQEPLDNNYCFDMHTNCWFNVHKK